MQRIPRKVVGIPQAEMAAFRRAPGAGTDADGHPPRIPAPEGGRSGGGRRTYAPSEDDVRFHRGLPPSKRGGGRRTYAPSEDDVRFHRGLPLSKRTPGRARVSAAAH